MSDLGEEIGKAALSAAVLAWPALAQWLRSKTTSVSSVQEASIASKVAAILPEESESAKAARVLRDG